MRGRSWALVGVAVALTAAIVPTLTAGPRLPPSRAPLPTVVEAGALAYEIRDGDTGALIPGKLTFDGIAGTPDPRFTHGDVGREEPGAIAAYNRVFSAMGVGALRIPVGTYDIYVSRGPEWELYVARGVKVDAKGAEVRAQIRHVVDTRGWLSADFHVHAAPSPDSRVPMVDRVYEFVAEGIDMIVSTDHNVVSDYAPIIQELDLGRYLTSACGDEITTATWGHFGAFPLPQSLEHSGQGAIHAGALTADEIFRSVRSAAPDAVVDVHHPRLERAIGYFDLGGLDSRTDEATRRGFSYDFDAVEVLNGYQDPDRRNIDQTIDDWFSLLLHGHAATALGNSDTHHLTYNLAGYPRNYVRVADDDPARVSAVEVARAVKAHHALFTTGPFLTLKVGGAEIGDLVAAPGGKLRAAIEVRAAPWVSVSLVRLYVDGKETQRWRVPPGVVDFRGVAQLELTRDAFVVARADGDRPMSPVIGDRTRFTVYPLALTNPVFVDVDGNGRWDPPIAHGAHGPSR
jgi:hypothetical protein